ncbi:pseudouridine synthase [Spirosoma soli]|uniref:Pseudouridine synthase n=1 Tax=Spirosoma soli TaxID=1770529 RepID=A0ABW5M730_9BACT
MNQDFDSNDSRDGNGRSSGRRDDDRNRGDRRNSAPPRFNRDNNARDNDRRNDAPPRFNRDNDRPRFERPTNRNNDSRSRDFDDRRPRFDRDRNSGAPSRSEGPRNRDDNRPDRFSDRRPSSDRNGDSDRPRFNRSTGDAAGRPRTDRSDDSAPRRPRFDRDRTDDKPRFERSNDRFGSDRKFNDRPDDRRSRPGEPRSNDRFGDKPRQQGTNFSDRNDRRPSFDRNSGPRDDKPRFNRTSDDNRNDGPRRFDRSNDERRGDDRRNTGGQDTGRRDSGFSRDRNDRNDRSDKPSFKRVGGFNRDADERNRFGDDKRNSSPRDASSRFSGEQRKESGDRRTGRYDKAPNYNLEQMRETLPYKKRDRYESEKPKRTAADDGLTRLNRYIANSGVCSRREADELIARGDISVNGKIVTEMGYKVKEGDTVKYGTKVLNPERFVYVLLNKPKDYITTTDDPNERRTVMELVADAGNFRMYPVGRLDRNTTGLLLLTNDGELADKLTHPSHNIRKIYQVELDKPITDEHFEAIQKGIELEDGPIKPDALSIVTPDAHVIGIEIHSGRNRIVRRIFENFGYEVTKLDRTTYAGLTKKDLPRGKWRFLDPKEVVKLKYFNS